MYASLPHLIFATELFEALTLLPAPASEVDDTSTWGAAEWAALGAVLGGVSTVILAIVATITAATWKTTVKRQGKYDAVKLMADESLSISNLHSTASRLAELLDLVTPPETKLISRLNAYKYACDKAFNLQMKVNALLVAADLDYSRIKGVNTLFQVRYHQLESLKLITVLSQKSKLSTSRGKLITQLESLKRECDNFVASFKC